jgi:hypothetical protein
MKLGFLEFAFSTIDFDLDVVLHSIYSAKGGGVAANLQVGTCCQHDATVAV